ncbi:hypothetical protein H4582DRAFT_2060229 [Lactarius indigo]|nr:hypothetical protein H4582DRAFT_2060229 [Lactarius indigo]
MAETGDSDRSNWAITTVTATTTAADHRTGTHQTFQHPYPGYSASREPVLLPLPSRRQLAERNARYTWSGGSCKTRETRADELAPPYQREGDHKQASDLLTAESIDTISLCLCSIVGIGPDFRTPVGMLLCSAA